MNLKEDNEKLRGLLRECVGQIDLLIEVYVEDDVEPEDIAISEQIKADIHAALSQQAAPHESKHHAQLLGQALGECIAAAGIIRPDASLNGPELLMFADDLKRHLSEQSGLADLVRIALHNGQLVPDPEMDGSTEVFGIKLDDMEALEAALSAQEVNKI